MFISDEEFNKIQPTTPKKFISDEEFNQLQVQPKEEKKPEEKKKGFLRKAGEAIISSEKGFGESIAQAIAAPMYAKEAEQNNARYMKAGNDMLALAKKTLDPVKRQTYMNLSQDYFNKAGSGIQDIVGELKTTKQVIGEAAGVALDVATAGTYDQAAKLAKSGQLLKPTLATAIPTAVSKLSSTGIKEAGKKIVGGATVGYGYDVASGLAGGESIRESLTPGFGTLIGAGLPALGYAFGATKEFVRGVKQVEPTVKQAIEKAVRPSVVGKRTAKQSEQYYAKAKDAVTSVINNKENLKFVDEFGEEAVGKLPSNLNEFSQAIEQTKKAVFEEYNALTKKSGSADFIAGGERGQDIFSTKVGFGKIIPELEKAANDKVLNLYEPATADYARKMAERYKDVGSLTTEEAEELIAKFNVDLKNFYKNPSYGSGTKVGIDAMVANNIRKSLDDTIMKATGEEYQKLKNVYGALSTIEKDVMHRAVVDARKNNKGLIDLTNIFSYGDIATGLLTGQPTIVGKGLLQRGIAAFYKLKNDPNQIIKGMFKDVEKSLKKDVKVETPISEKGINRIFPQEGKESPKKVAKTILDKTKNIRPGLTIEDVSKKGSPTVGKTVLDKNPLYQEARKYKSAEEFIKAQTNVFHGTPEKGFKLEKGKPLFLTENFDEANTYAGYSYNTKPTGEVVEFYAKKGKSLDLNKTENVKKVFQDIYGSPKLKKAYDSIPETYRYADDYGDIQYLEPRNSQSDFEDWMMMEYQSKPKIDTRLGLKVRTGSYSFEKGTLEVRKNLQDAFSIYGKPSRQSVYNRWEDLIKYAKQKGYDFIEHTTESPDTSILFPEKIALNPEKSLLTKSQLTDIWNKANKKKTVNTVLSKGKQDKK